MSKAIKCFSLTKKQTSVCNREAMLSFTLSTLSNCPCLQAGRVLLPPLLQLSPIS